MVYGGRCLCMLYLPNSFWFLRFQILSDALMAYFCTLVISGPTLDGSRSVGSWDSRDLGTTPMLPHTVGKLHDVVLE